MTGHLAILVVFSIAAPSVSAKPDKPLVRIGVESDGSLSYAGEEGSARQQDVVEPAGASSSLIALGAHYAPTTMAPTVFMTNRTNDGDFSKFVGGPSGFCKAEAARANLPGHGWCACISDGVRNGKECQTCEVPGKLWMVGNLPMTSDEFKKYLKPANGEIPDQFGNSVGKREFWTGGNLARTCSNWTTNLSKDTSDGPDDAVLGSHGKIGHGGGNSWHNYNRECGKRSFSILCVREHTVEVYLSESTIAAIGEVAGKAAVNEACNSAAGLHQNISKLLLAQKTQLEADQLEQRQKQVKEHAEYVQDYLTERSKRLENITTVEHPAETTNVNAQQQAHKDLLKQEFDSHIAEQQLQLEKFDLSTEKGNTTIANDHKAEKQKLEAKQKAKRDLQENQHQQILDGTPASTQTGVEVSGFIKRSTEY